MRVISKKEIRLFCLALAAVLILLLVLPVSVQASVSSVRTAPVYSYKSTWAAVIGQVAEGMVLPVVRKSGSYYKLDCDGMYGYIHQSNVRYVEDLGYVVDCSDQEDPTEFIQYSPSDGFLLRTSIAEMSADYLGVRYVYGGSSRWGFDCSGLTSYLYQQHGITINRCADMQMQNGLVVDREDLQIGDLVFFDIDSPWLASHVGIYVGSGQMIHASTSSGVRYSSLDADYWAKYYVGARRIVSLDIELENTHSGKFTPIAIDMATE